MTSNRLEFKSDFTRVCFYLLSINGLLSIVLFVLTGSSLYAAITLFVLINTCYVINIVSKPIKIIIDPNKALLETHYLLNFLMKPTIALLPEIECSFDYRRLARGGKARALKIKLHGTILVDIIPNYSGWSEQDLALIFEQLNNVKKFN